MLTDILDVLVSAVLGGGVQVLTAKGLGTVQTRYKDGAELVTSADELSDSAIRAIFESRLRAMIPDVSFQLEESGDSGPLTRQRAGADPLDGTSHFASGGSYYSVQAHYLEDGIPLIGVILQPEIFFPLAENQACTGRLVYAIRGQGAFFQRTEFKEGSFTRGPAQSVVKRKLLATSNYAACIPIGTKMTTSERERARRVYEHGPIAVTTGLGGAGSNVLMVVFGGQDVYANFGAGNDLDLVPPQVIAEEVGMTVWGVDRRSPVWNVRKQPFIVAPNDLIANKFFEAAGL